jgi:hypothetical protein
MLCEPGWEQWGMRNKTHTDIQTYRRKTEKWYREGCMFLMGKVSAYLSQSVYFIGQYKEKTQVKIKLQQLLDLR